MIKSYLIIIVGVVVVAGLVGVNYLRQPEQSIPIIPPSGSYVTPSLSLIPTFTPALTTFPSGGSEDGAAKSKVQKDLWEGKIGKYWIIDNQGLVTVSVRFFKGIPNTERDKAILSHSGVVIDRSSTGEYYRIKISINNVRQLAKEGIVAWIEPYIEPKLSN